jgi:galactose mutarotase-like enzyme
MHYTLKNQYLTVTSKSEGAELTSILDNNTQTEYLWTADNAYWSRHAPILFPIVGKLKNNSYKVNKVSYSLTQHGFARDCEFRVVSQSNTQIIYELSWNSDTLTIYPYKFKLEVTYTLVERLVKVYYTVTNIDESNIHFSIGAHPGFNCPLMPDSSFNDYYFEFEKPETASIMVLNSTGLISRATKPYLNQSRIIEFNEHTFKNDALIFSNLQSEYVSLKSKTNASEIRFHFKEFPYLGLWSKPEGAPFVCIEPWFGHADFEDSDNDFSQKAGVLKLDTGKIFNCTYSVYLKS